MKFLRIFIFLVLTLHFGCKNSNVTGPSGLLDYKIAYFTDAMASLHVIDIDGSNDFAISPFISRGTSVDWFPDGSSLIFSELIAYPFLDTAWVWLYEFRTGQKRLLFSTTIVAVGDLNVSPDGQMVACILYHNDNTGAELSVFDADGGNRRSLTPPNQFVYNCRWSPNGSQIVFNLDTNICTINPDGSNFSQLTTSPCYNPSYSPDGTKIVYSLHYKNGLWAIGVMNANGSSQHLITPLDYTLRVSPEWSPDGKYIAYMQQDSALISRVFRMDANGQNVRQLSTGAGSHFYPRWLRDGRIVYMSNLGLNLWIMNKDGNQLKQITNIPLSMQGGNLRFAISKSLMGIPIIGH